MKFKVFVGEESSYERLDEAISEYVDVITKKTKEIFSIKDNLIIEKFRNLLKASISKEVNKQLNVSEYVYIVQTGINGNITNHLKDALIGSGLIRKENDMPINSIYGVYTIRLEG